MLAKFIIFLFNIQLLLAIDTKVELVQILFRHGDRTPVSSYPTDPYNETTWDKYGGFGQLTQTGMNRHFQYGQFLRNRYADFLDAIYSKKRVFIRSTDYDRTIMSAQSLLSGLFEPTDYQKWNPDINWQPIAIHTTDAKSDTMFYSSQCPRLDQLKAQVLKSDEFIQINSQYKDLFEILEKNTGVKNIDLDDMWKIGDVLFCENAQNLTLPDWAESNYDRIVGSLRYGFYFDYRLTEMAKLTSGAVLNDMRNNINNKIKSSTSNQLYLYSAHDTYVAALVKLLNLTEDINQPPYASSVTLELRKSVNSVKNSNNVDDYFVQIFYKNNTGNDSIDLHLMNIYGCDTLCPLGQFLNLTQDLVVTDFQSVCKAKQDKSTSSDILLYSIIAFSAVVAISILILTLISFSKKRTTRYDQL